jgi:HlyD family secretion protein
VNVRKWLATGTAVLVVGGGLLGWRFAAASTRTTDSVLPLSGRLEADDSAIAPKTSGRIVEIRVREGDTVQAGDLIARLDDQQVRARAEQARVAVTAADARVQAAERQAGVLEEQLQQSELQTGQANVDASGRVQQAEADLAAADADLARQEAANRLALFDREAYTTLAAAGAVSERQGKQAAATADQQAAAVAAATRRVEAARGGLVTARANLTNERIRGAQTAGVRQQIAQQHAEIASATANADHARAQLREAEANLDDLIVTAPFAGTVLTRTAEPGEVVQGGTPLVTLVDLARVYLRGYIPEGQIGHVKVGQAARVYLDSAPDRPVEALVSRVDPQATFTPENTYFRDDRVKQVIGLKLQLKGAVGLAKPGMPADGEILVRGSAWPSSSR